MDTEHWIALDRKHCWHPFTAQKEWETEDSLMLSSGEGVWLRDTDGNEYIDGNSSIWTNIHGHNHPALNEAITHQLTKVAHTSYLGYGHPLASELAERLCHFFPAGTLSRCFFSDDGSTAMEVAMKMSLQSRMQTGKHQKTGFICFNNSYHGDTMGAASIGGVSLFFDRFAKLGLPTKKVHHVAELKSLPEELLASTTAVVIEPIIQGVNQMTPWPEGMLKELSEWAQTHDIHLILDEVMTGFGRTGKMFACQHEGVVPDFLCLAKGLTGGYMPMAATLTRESIYKAFAEKREHTFFYGHSYTANPLGCAVAMASLDLFEKEQTLKNVAENTIYTKDLMAKELAPIPFVYEIRQVGMVIGIDLRNADGTPLAEEKRIGTAVCKAAWKYQLLTRPILDTIVFMPPLSISKNELKTAVLALRKAITETLAS